MTPWSVVPSRSVVRSEIGALGHPRHHVLAVDRLDDQAAVRRACRLVEHRDVVRSAAARPARVACVRYQTWSVCVSSTGTRI